MITFTENSGTDGLAISAFAVSIIIMLILAMATIKIRIKVKDVFFLPILHTYFFLRLNTMNVAATITTIEIAMTTKYVSSEERKNEVEEVVAD